MRPWIRHCLILCSASVVSERLQSKSQRTRRPDKDCHHAQAKNHYCARIAGSVGASGTGDGYDAFALVCLVFVAAGAWEWADESMRTRAFGGMGVTLAMVCLVSMLVTPPQTWLLGLWIVAGGLWVLAGAWLLAVGAVCLAARA